MDVHERARPAHDDWAERSTRELLSEVLDQGQRLLREEVRLARLEVRDEVKEVATSGGLVGGGAAVAYAAFLVLCFAAVFALSLALPAWASALIVGGALAIGAGALFAAGRAKARRTPLRPKETLETLREDQRWVNETTRSVPSTRRARA